ncbi:TetR/AcrR family transcriptional regulator [Sphingobium tyrosinilyticum]|uniref:TetR/AcrR family transcriptional regulator n=1 Tax=Sphingobium tyrosinilyticum TaxID=2715436 RepID=A0ABV9F4T8_9SPHN
MTNVQTAGRRGRPQSNREVSYNLAGQRLGRKGQETRERILSAMLRLLADPQGPPVNLTNVAREASVRLTNLYLYFPDFGDLLLAALARVMETADEAFVDLLRPRWPDERLRECALAFLRAHYQFWRTHARLLHMRNRLSDDDARILEHRQRTTFPMLDLLIGQMDCPPDPPDARWRLMATVVLTGFERMATVVTTPHFNPLGETRKGAGTDGHIDALIQTEARLMELAIRDARALPGARSAVAAVA